MCRARILETESARETLPAMQSIVGEINAYFKRKAVCRIHADRAKDITGEAIDDHFCRQGVRVTETPGYKPNANPRAESAVNVVKTRANVMLVVFGPPGRVLWPAAVHHA